MGSQPAAVLKPGQSVLSREMGGCTMRPHATTRKTGQTHASMTIAASTDYGLTWKIKGPIIVQIAAFPDSAAKWRLLPKCATRSRSQTMLSASLSAL
jgi:hypothetical protein